MNKIIRKFRLLSIPALLVAVILGASIYVNNVHASDPGSILNKWRWAHYYECLQRGGWVGSFDASEVSESKKVVKYLYEDTNGDVFLPSYRYGHELADESISCYKSIVGKDSWIGSLQDQSSIKFSQPSEMETLLRNLDYLPDSETGQSKQFTIHATTATNEIDYALITPQTEWTPGEEDSVVIYTEPNDSGGTHYWYDDGWDNFFNAISISFGDGNITVAMEYGWLSSCSAPENQSVTVPLYVDPLDTRAALESALGNLTWYTTCYHDSPQIQRKKTTRYDFVVGEVVNMGDSGTYRHQHIDDRYTGASLASQNYGGGTLTDLVPTREEQYNLYLYYLQHFIPQNVQNRLTSNPTSTVNLTKIKLKSTDGTFKDFYANLNGVSPSSTTVYSLNNYYFNEDNSKHFPKVVAMTMQQVIDWFNSVNTSTLGEVDLTEDDDGAVITTTTTTSGGDQESQGDPEEEACYQNAKSLGWIMCPMIFGLRDLGEKFYSVAEPFLETNSSIVSELGSQDSGLYQAWLVFRNIANIIFVILFLFIIFSQLTGWGIDNYGIKKMLPKLILVAILVNISYVICAIAVDASNIIGHGIRGLFESIASNVADKGGLGASASAAVGNSIKKVVALMATGGVGLAGVAIAAEISGSGWFLVVPILLFLLTVLASAFFALVILGLRQAFIVALIVISPVAFALSLLPNTESAFKRWLNIAKGLLMVYPVVGAVIGIGYLTSRILMNTDQGFIMTIVAGILLVAPYFLIPSITRKAMDAVGNIASKLTNMGKTGVSRANHGIKGSDLYNDAKAGDKARRAQSWMNSKRAQKIADDINSGKKVSQRRANKYARRAQLANSDAQAMINARTAQSQYKRLAGDPTGTGLSAALSAANMAEDSTATKNYETMLAAGDYKYDSGIVDENGNKVMQRVDSQSVDQLANALKHEMSLSKAGGYDANKVRALSNALAAKGKEGRAKMYDVVSAGGATNQAIKDFSSNIMNNHAGTMKEKARSLYEFAKSTSDVSLNEDGSVNPSYTTDKNGVEKLSNGLVANGDGTFSLKGMSDFASSGTGSLTAADMTNMDKQQLDRYIDSANKEDGSLKNLGQLAYQALNDDHLSQNLSATSRGLLEQLRDKAQQAGYDVTKGSVTLSVDHSQPQQTQPVTDEMRAKIESQERVPKEVQDAIDKHNNGGGHITGSGIILP